MSDTQNMRSVSEPGKHYHYSVPHEPILCQRSDCPSWLPQIVGPNGECDDPRCPCNTGESVLR